ncbi:hypothetical protein TNCV_2608281 [Trichonephila clavipes]|uniref:Uncharacterized protein n=1 Tax=Trichonephila clavipes TaxID=2585209 RepID=A0A8X6RZG7_TRICX|nr:hypothetical protein TNCV_2608281 [Trichonephila clavipes]
MTSARSHEAIVYCLNSGSDDSQTGRHNGDKKKKDERERSPALDGEKGKALPWMEKVCEESPGWNGREESAGEKGFVRDWSGKMMNAGSVENRI